MDALDENYGAPPSVSNIVEIKLKDSKENEVIEIDLDDLPDGEDLLGILRQEQAELHTWVRIALAYYQKGDNNTFVKILEVSGSDAKLEYPNFEKDQMRALDSLAAVYCGQVIRFTMNKTSTLNNTPPVGQARTEKDKVKKKDLMTKATLLYTTADKIIIYDINHLLGRAFFCFLENNYEQADAQFKYILQQVQDNIPALLGEACISFNRKDYKNALFFYKKAMKFNPDCPGADVRLGIGLSYFKLGKLDKARLAFERALQMDDRCVGALIGLATLESNTGTEEGVKRGVELLCRAYHVDAGQPMALNHLANHFFFRKDYDKVVNLARHAFSLSEVEACRAESCFQLARAFHVRGDYDEALRYYFQATQLAGPNFVLPFFGLGQMYIDRKEYEKAIDAFEKVLKSSPDNYETLKVLGSLYANCESGSERDRRERRHKAREHLAKVVSQKEYEDDVEAWIDYAQLLESEDANEALRAYQKAETLLRDDVGVQVPPEILNNIGSCYYALGNFERARLNFDEALLKIEHDPDGGDEYRALKITVQYNQARAAEQLCDTELADSIYRDILQRKPNYIDCYFRLGCMARDRGDLHEANERFKEALQYRQNSATAWTLIGNLHMTKGELLPVQKKFEQILKFKDYTDDPYSVVALGNVWLETLYMPVKDKEKEKRHRERALQMFSKALKVAPNNIWAANGIGCALACRGQVQEARDVFAQVREATADFPDVWLNIAHIYVEVKKYVAAIQMYENCMKKFNMHTNIDLLLYLARAQFRAGKLNDCKGTLLTARQVAPNDALVVLNMALLLKQLALIALKDEKAGLLPVLAAVDNLQTAEKYLKELALAAGTLASSGAHHKHVDRTRAADEARQCGDMLKQAQHHVARARKLDDEQKALRAKQEAERDAIVEEQMRQQREREENARTEMQRLKEQRQMFINKTKDILFIPEVKEEPKQSSSKGRRPQRPTGAPGEFVNDSSDLGEYVGEGERPAKRREPLTKESRKERRERRRQRRERRRKTKEGEAPASEDEEAERQDRHERIRAERQADEDLSAKQRAKVKSKAIVSSSGSSSSAGEAKKKSAASSSSGDETLAKPNVPTPAKETASMQRVATDSSDDSSQKSGGGGKKPAASSSSSDNERPQRKPQPSKRSRVTKKKAASSDESDDQNDDGSDDAGPKKKAVASSDESGAEAPPPKKAVHSDSEQSSDKDAAAKSDSGEQPAANDDSDNGPADDKTGTPAASPEQKKAGSGSGSDTGSASGAEAPAAGVAASASSSDNDRPLAKKQRTRNPSSSGSDQ